MFAGWRTMERRSGKVAINAAPLGKLSASASSHFSTTAPEVADQQAPAPPSLTGWGLFSNDRSSWGMQPMRNRPVSLPTPPALQLQRLEQGILNPRCSLA